MKEVAGRDRCAANLDARPYFEHCHVAVRSNAARAEDLEAWRAPTDSLKVTKTAIRDDSDCPETLEQARNDIASEAASLPVMSDVTRNHDGRLWSRHKRIDQISEPTWPAAAAVSRVERACYGVADSRRQIGQLAADLK
jgi:hypothetical protein